MASRSRRVFHLHSIMLWGSDRFCENFLEEVDDVETAHPRSRPPVTLRRRTLPLLRLQQPVDDVESAHPGFAARNWVHAQYVLGMVVIDCGEGTELARDDLGCHE